MTARTKLTWLLVAAVALSGAACHRDEEFAPPAEQPVRQPPRETAQRPPERPAPTPPPARLPPGMAVSRRTLPTPDKAASVLLLEEMAPREIVVGREFDYRLKLTNLTRELLTEVALSAELSRNFKIQATGPKAAVAAQKVVWKVGRLQPSEAKEFLVRGQATGTGAVTCCCEATYKNPELCLAVTAVQPALRIVKSGPAEAILCDIIPFRLVVTNTGTGKAANVKVRDDLPEGLKTMEGQSAVLLDAGDLAAGQSRDFTIRTKAGRTGKLANKATATADDGLTATSQEVVVMVRQPVLEVDKSGPATLFVGRTATYTIAVTNSGDAVARDTVLTDAVPAGATFVRASDGGQVAGGQVTWQLGALAPKQSRKVSLVLRADRRGTLHNAAVARAYCTQASDRTTTVVKGIPAILLECVDLEDPIEVGANTAYVITVTNQGSAEGTNIVVTCTLPAEQQLVSAAGAEGVRATVEGRTVTFAALKSLAPKVKATYRVTVKGLKPGDVRFQVSLKSDQMTTPAMETESTHIYE